MNKRAQSTIEFTFAMMAILFLIFGMVMVFRWAGMDLAQRRFSEDISLTTLQAQTIVTPIVLPNGDLTSEVSYVYGDPASELNADLDNVLPMAAVYHGTITNGNVSQ